MSTLDSTKPHRGGCLTIFLILMLITNPLTSIYYLFASSGVRETFPNMPVWTLPVLGLLGIANFIFALAVWKWKKWGVYGFAVSALIAFVINVTDLGLANSLSGLVGVGVLVLLVRNAWDQME